jgi:L-aminopeptidase/D-esterase-like protein
LCAATANSPQKEANAVSNQNHTDPLEAVVAALLAHAIAKGVAAQAACSAVPYDHQTAAAAVGEQGGALDAYTIALQVQNTWKPVSA